MEDTARDWARLKAAVDATRGRTDRAVCELREAAIILLHQHERPVSPSSDLLGEVSPAPARQQRGEISVYQESRASRKSCDVCGAKMRWQNSTNQEDSNGEPKRMGILVGAKPVRTTSVAGRIVEYYKRKDVHTLRGNCPATT